MPFLLSNFIIFDLRHDLRMAKALIDTGKASKFFAPLGSWLGNRINNAISLQLFEGQSPISNLFIIAVFILVMALTTLYIRKENKYRHIYFLFIFYYFGYFIMSFFNKGILLFHYIYLLMPLTTLWLVSFLKGKYKILFLLLIGFLYTSNLQFSKSDINVHRENSMNNYNSWKALSLIANDVSEREKGKEFGYFVFAPDALAYQPRYAMIYNFKKNHSMAFEYTKKSTTYIIAAPPPANNPYMTYVWWSKVPVRISSEPVKVKKFANGFTIIIYNLSAQEQKISHDKSIELGIHFR